MTYDSKAERKLNCLWQPLEEIRAGLDAFASSAEEIRELGIDELTDLIHFQDDLERTAAGLKNRIERSASGEDSPPRQTEVITSADHPLIKILRKRYAAFRALAAKIRRTNLKIN